MTTPNEIVARRLLKQAEWCQSLGSRLYSTVLRQSCRGCSCQRLCAGRFCMTITTIHPAQRLLRVFSGQSTASCCRARRRNLLPDDWNFTCEATASILQSFAPCFQLPLTTTFVVAYTTFLISVPNHAAYSSPITSRILRRGIICEI